MKPNCRKYADVTGRATTVGRFTARGIALLFLICHLPACAIWHGPQETARNAASEDEISVVRAAQSMFDAMATRDTAFLNKLIAPEAILFSSDEGQQPPVLIVRTAKEFVTSIADSKNILVERIRSPQVQIDGSVATLWAPYTFQIGNRLTHCGYDSLQFVRRDGEWRVAAISYTRHPVSTCK
jgi:hypothetical protein